MYKICHRSKSDFLPQRLGIMRRDLFPVPAARETGRLLEPFWTSPSHRRDSRIRHLEREASPWLRPLDELRRYTDIP